MAEEALTSTSFVVSGMTCGHCVAAVTAELRSIDEVVDVTVDLESGRVVIGSSAPIDPATIAAAVEEAGYEVAE